MAPRPAHPSTTERNLGPAKAALASVGLKDPAVLRRWREQGKVYAERVGQGRWLYDLDDVAEQRKSYPRHDGTPDTYVADLVALAPKLSPRQIERLRAILSAAPDYSPDAA
jgi:hypothetical protein